MFLNAFKILLIFGGCTLASAQQYRLSNKPQLNQKNSIYHRPVGKIYDQYYFLNYSDEYLSSGFSIEIYDNELGFVKDRFIQNNKKNLVVKLFTADSSIYWISLTKKKRNLYVLTMNRLDMDMDSAINSVALKELQLKDYYLNQLFFDYSPNRKSWSFSYCSDGNESNAVFNTIIGKCGYTKIEESKIEIPVKPSQIVFDNSIISDNDNVISLIMASSPNEFFSKGRQLSHYVIETGKNAVAFYKLETKEPILNVELSYNKKDNLYQVIGLNGDSYTGDVKGYFGFEIPEYNLKPQNDFENNFDENTIKQILGLKKNKKSIFPRNLFIRKVIFTSNKKLALVLEEYTETRQLETYYLNGIPQTSTKILYHFGNILSLFINSNGILDTAVVIQKDQSSTINNLYFMGFSSYVCHDGIHFVFNNDISRGNEVNDITLSVNATTKKKIFFSGDQFTNIIIPYDGKEVEYCAFTVPLYRDKQWFWMKIFNDD